MQGSQSRGGGATAPGESLTALGKPTKDHGHQTAHSAGKLWLAAMGEGGGSGPGALKAEHKSWPVQETRGSVSDHPAAERRTNSVLETCLPMTSDGAAAREATGGGTGGVAAQGRETAPVGENKTQGLLTGEHGRKDSGQAERPEDYRGGGCTLRPPEMEARRLGLELPGKGKQEA